MRAKWHLMSLVTLACALAWGCQSSTDTEPAPSDTGTETESTDDAAALEQGATQLVSLCGSCGEIKGTGKCCDEDCETCGDCGLHKGAPMCCKVSADFGGEDVDCCAKCGEVAGS